MRRFPPARAIAPSLLFTVAALGLGSIAQAATFNVTTTADTAPNGCNVGTCTLREAVIAANSAAGSVINIPAGTYTLTIPGADNAITSTAIGDLDILVATTINGAGVATTFVQAGGSPGIGIHRIFDNHSQGNVRIANLTVRNGVDTENHGGGCIRNLGVLTLDSVTVSGCRSTIGGAGISSFHTLTVVRSTITANILQGASAGVPVSGGGIAGGPGPFTGANSRVNITQSTISNNVAQHTSGADLHALGGGFANTAVMHITSSTISGNSALNVGGGINTGTMVISETHVTGNTARFDVGGVDNDALMTIDNSTFSNNQSGVGCVGTECNRAFAGGALNTAGGTMNVNNSTFSGNICQGPGTVSGGGLLNSTGTLNVSSSTFVGNTCKLGPGIASGGGGPFTTTVKNTIVAGNTATDAASGDCYGVFVSGGYNLIQNATGCVITGTTTGNQIGVSPNVGPLQDNGGPTPTRALNAASPARNTGNPGGCLDHAGRAGPLLRGDQRGYARPQEGRCDIGAFEFGIEAVIVYRLRHPTIGAYLFTIYPFERDKAQWQFGYGYEGVCCNWLPADAGDGRTELFRLFSASAGEYFFTASAAERDSAVANFGYVAEGVSAYCYTSQVAGSRPWYRLRLGNKHLYTIHDSERDFAVSLGWTVEGVTCFLPAP